MRGKSRPRRRRPGSLSTIPICKKVSRWTRCFSCLREIPCLADWIIIFNKGAISYRSQDERARGCTPLREGQLGRVRYRKEAHRLTTFRTILLRVPRMHVTRSSLKEARPKRSRAEALYIWEPSASPLKRVDRQSSVFSSEGKAKASSGRLRQQNRKRTSKTNPLNHDYSRHHVG